MPDIGFASLLATILLVALTIVLYTRGDIGLNIHLLYREERVEEDPRQLLQLLGDSLEKRGYHVDRRDNTLIVHAGLVDVVVKPMPGPEGGAVIGLWMTLTTTTIVLLILGLALYIAPAVLTAVLAYAKYDEVTGIVKSILS